MDDVRYATDTGIATITIDRPAVKNAFRRRTLLELNESLRRAEADDGVYALVLTGAEGAFCAGADVGDMPDWADQPPEEYAGYLGTVGNVVRQLRTMGTPSVAAVAGPAVGAGCDFALACDLRVVGEDAVLREGFVRVGLVPGDGGAWLLTRLVGEARAKQYLLTGRDITPQAAVDMGLAVERAADPLATAGEWARELRDLPATAVQGTKQLVRDEPFETHLRRATEHQLECITDPEHEEAVRAFMAGREPEFDREY